MRCLLYILLLFLLAQATTFAQVDSTAYVQAQADSIVVDNTIKETIRLNDVSFETIVHKDGKYCAVVKTGTGEIEEVDESRRIRTGVFQKHQRPERINLSRPL